MKHTHTHTHTHRRAHIHTFTHSLIHAQQEYKTIFNFVSRMPDCDLW